MHLLTHVLAQTLFCKHTFTNKYWALCLKQKYTKISSLSRASLSQPYNMQASSGKIPIGACLTWLLKAYFTLYWPTSLHFLLCLHTSIPFLFPFSTPLPYRSIGSFFPFSPVKSSETFCMSGQRGTGLFFSLLCWVIAVQHLRANSLPYLDKHVALGETKQRRGQRMRADVI